MVKKPAYFAAFQIFLTGRSRYFTGKVPANSGGPRVSSIIHDFQTLQQGFSHKKYVNSYMEKEKNLLTDTNWRINEKSFNLV